VRDELIAHEERRRQMVRRAVQGDELNLGNMMMLALAITDSF